MYAELKQIVCVDCGMLSPVRFYKTSTRCVSCAENARAKGKAVRRTLNRSIDPQKYHRKDFIYDLKKNYGLSLEKFEALYKSQKGCCACCGKHESNFKRGLHVDHDHTSGQVRGLLCTRCNPGLGYFEDSIAKLEMAITYLKKFKKTG